MELNIWRNKWVIKNQFMNILAAKLTFVKKVS
jgi:hypothetical protein